jgi:hypothetical protein
LTTAGDLWTTHGITQMPERTAGPPLRDKHQPSVVTLLLRAHRLVVQQHR